MADAPASANARADAIVALAQRVLLAVPWPRPEDGLRTLVSSGGESALPVFSSREELETAVDRFGWRSPDGSTPEREIEARDAFQYARERSLLFVVVDIAADHALEISRDEFEPLLTAAARRDSQGPYAGTGRVGSALASAARTGSRSTPPGPASQPPPAGPLPASPALSAPPPGSSPGIVAADASADLGAPPLVAILASIRLGAPIGASDDALLDRIAGVLREFPEVEFACAGSAGGVNAFGLRVDARMRKRLDTIGAELGKVVPPGAGFYLLDDPDHFRAARADALVFFPWRRR